MQIFQLVAAAFEALSGSLSGADKFFGFIKKTAAFEALSGSLRG
jgi:hypothetical protein